MRVEELEGRDGFTDSLHGRLMSLLAWERPLLEARHVLLQPHDTHARSIEVTGDARDVGHAVAPDLDSDDRVPVGRVRSLRRAIEQRHKRLGIDIPKGL